MVEGKADGFENLGGLLERAGVACARADRATGLQAFYRERPDLVLLDVSAPIEDAKHILDTIREISEAPVMALSSGEESMEAALALRMGADDYLHDEFTVEETLARVEALIRRGSGNAGPGHVLSDEFIEVDLHQHRVSALGSEVDLTPTEFRLLATFIQHPGQALSHAQLLSMAWDHGYRASDEVKLYVSYLRRKLKSAAGLDPVETLRGVGYRYKPHRVAEADG